MTSFRWKLFASLLAFVAVAMFAGTTGAAQHHHRHHHHKHKHPHHAS